MEIEQRIQDLLKVPPYSLSFEEHQGALLSLLQEELKCAGERNPRFRNYLNHWPVDFRAATRVADLPFLPVGVFKADPPLALVGSGEIKRTLSSSATTGQVPSRVVLDVTTARRMTKGITSIIRDFIGPARRPYLVIDAADNMAAKAQLTARGTAIQGLTSFATEVVCCLSYGPQAGPCLDLDILLDCAARWKETEVLAYGFTHVIWTQLVEPLQRKNIKLDLPKIHVLHSGGWKRLEQQAVTKDMFVRGVASIFNCGTDRVIDYYGMVENVGVVYPDCPQGNKHVPAFADIVVRDPLTLQPVACGERGLVQVCSILPASFPGFLILTEDLADLIGYDGCPCGRRGTHFRFAGRVPKAEVRGCGNVETRSRGFATGQVA